MGCFVGCFGSSKNQKRKKLRYKVIPRDQKPKILDILKADASFEQIINENPSTAFTESRAKTEVPQLSLKKRKKVTFDTNVTTYEHIYDSTESLLEKNEKGETFPKSEDDSVALSTTNYRYGNCLESDDEIEDFDHEEYEFDEDDYDLDDDDDHDDDGMVISVLNPVENLTQWKALKSKGSTRNPLTFNGKNENSPEFENVNQETAADTSLSNWFMSTTTLSVR